jgi:hypothetical protein
MELKVYQFDLDGTLCTTERGPFGLKDYTLSKPFLDRIAKVNKLYDEGHLIKIETARGRQTDMDWEEFTKKQLAQWGLKYHVLRVGSKMHADFYIDDKGLSDREFFND